MRSETPVFRPSAEEWRDPLAYIAYIRQNGAEEAGMAKIIPPEGWNSSFAIDRRRLKLPTKLVSVHMLAAKETSAAVLQHFWDAYNAFMVSSGFSRLKKTPTFMGQEIDLYRLFRLVSKRGGYAAVSDDKGGWRDVVLAMQIVDKGGNAGYTVKAHYQKLLLPYEDYCRAQTDEGAGLLVAALDADHSEDMSDAPEAKEDTIDDDEAAEILEAMLGLAPALQASEPSKKRRRSTTKDQPQSGIKIPQNIFTMVCEKCKGGHYEDKIILCDRCDKGWHLFCLSPPLETVPEGEWVCPTCVSNELEGDAIRRGEAYSIEDIERIAASFERQWFGSDEQAAAAAPSLRESEFWRIVEDADDVAEVLLVDDVDTGMYGSGFSRRSPTNSEPEAAMAEHPWNLNNIPEAAGEHSNLLRLLQGHVPGLTRPSLSVSMLFSAVPWRVHPHGLYGLDYLHFGAVRQHYAVPAHAAALLESALRDFLPPQLARQPEVLYRIHSLLAPRMLAAAGVPCTSTPQEPGTFILTLPNAYHTAVSLGVNCSESVCFAPADWLRFGAMSVSKYRLFRKRGVFSHEGLVVRTATAAVTAAGSAAGNNPISARTCRWIGQEMHRITEEEGVLRAKLWSEGLVRSRRVDQPVGMDFGLTEDAECAICHMPLYLSAVECDCCPPRRTCLHHAASLCECRMRRRRLAWRHTLKELRALEAGVTAQVPADVVARIEGEEQHVAAAVGVAAKSCALAATAAAATAAAAAGDGDGSDDDDDAMAVKEEEQEGKVETTTTTTTTTTAPLQPKTEDLEGLEALAGFMSVMAAEQDDEESPASPVPPAELPPRTTKPSPTTTANRKRKREITLDSTLLDPSTLTLVNANGFVQGPVSAFQILDIYREDRDAAGDWLKNLRESCTAWQQRAQLALEHGGGMAADLTDLVEEAEQYLWGGVDDADEAAVRELQPRLADAEDYMAAVNAALRGKPSLEAVEALLRQEPKPLANPPGLQQLMEGAAAARDWLARSADLVSPDAFAVDVRTLELAVNEAARLPIALTEAKALRERLNTARKVADAIRAALPTAREAGRRKKDEVAISVEYLHALSVQADSAHVDMPEVANLHSALDRLEAWQGKVDDLDGGRVQLTELKSLIEEAELLPALLPDADQLRILNDRAEAWLRTMHNLVRNRAPMKKMRDHLHAGLRLPVDVPEVEELRLDIRRREWEETAKRAASSKGTLHALMEVLSTAHDMGAENSTLAMNLQAKVDAAATWERSAAAFVSRFSKDGGCPEHERPELEGVATVVGVGAGTGVKMERLNYLTQQLQAATKWMARAQECLPTAPPIIPTPLASDDDNDGGDDVDAMDVCSPGGVDPLTLALMMEATAAAADTEAGEEAENLEEQQQQQQQQQDVNMSPDASPEAVAPQPLIPPAVTPTFDTVTSLLAEYDDKLIIKAEEAAGLRTLRAAAEAWLEEAKPVLEQDYVVDEQLSLLNELISKGRATGVAMEQVDILEANVEALLWGQTVRGILEKLPPLPEPKTTLPTPNEEEEEEQVAADVNTTTTADDAPFDVSEQPEAAPAIAIRATATLAGGQEDAIDVPPPIALATLTGGVPPVDEPPSDTEDDRPMPTTPHDQRPALTSLMKLLEEGGILPCDEALFARFQKYVEAGQEFEREARTVLTMTMSSKDGGAGAGGGGGQITGGGGGGALINVRALEKLIANGERLALGMPALPRLHEVLHAHDKWEQRVRDLMASAGARPAFGELQVFQQTARMSPVTSNLRRHIDAVVEAVEVWKERVRRSTAKRNTGMRLDRCFEVLGHSIDCAVEQFERRLEVEKQLVASGPRRPGPRPDGKEEDERELYCLCQQPYNVDTSMISCDLCGEWYHMRCVGVTQTQARSLRKYSCPICAAVRNVMEPLDYALSKLRRTRRPTREELGNLLSEVRALPVTVEEEGSLERLLVKFDRWGTATNRAIEVHEASRKDSAGQVLPLSDGMLHQLCKSALALEVDSTDHAERILHLLRCNRWRARVGAVLGASSSAPGGKASAEAVAKLLMEADRLKVDAPTDVAGSRLLAAADATRAWQDSVRQCVADLKAAGGAADAAFNEAVERAKALMTAAESLPIRVDREVEKLAEYAKPYCLCRRAYDEQMPMLDCDRCGEWFHFECVGLKGSSSTAAAAVPAVEGAAEGAAPPLSSAQQQDTTTTPTTTDAPPTAAVDTAGDGEGENVVPENFLCPLCCMKSGSSYQFFHKLPPASMDALKAAAAAMPITTTTAAGGGGVPQTTTLQQQQQQQQLQQQQNQHMTPQAAAAAAAAAAQMASMYPQSAWPYAMAAAQRNMMAAANTQAQAQSGGGVGGGGGAMMPQQQQALQSLMEASFPQGMVPGMMHPAMFGFHPAMAQAMQAQQHAAMAHLQQQQQQQQAAQATAAAAAAGNGDVEIIDVEEKAVEGPDAGKK